MTKLSSFVVIQVIKVLTGTPFTTIGKKYGVTDNAIRNLAKSYGLI